MTPIIEYIRNGVMLENRAEVVKVKARSTRYSIVNEVLYRRSFSGSYLKVLTQREGRARRGASSLRLVRDAHRRTNVVPLNCNSGLLLADKEARV